jgi:hypothetical protein
VSINVLKDANIFENRKDLNIKEKDEVEPILSNLFKERIAENKVIFKAKQIEEYNILHNIQPDQNEDEKDLFGSDDGEKPKKKSKSKQIIEESEEDKPNKNVG